MEKTFDNFWVHYNPTEIVNNTNIVYPVYVECNLENGEIIYPVNEVTIASNLNDMFKMIIPLNDLDFKTSINSPSLFIEQMTIAGK